MQRESEWVMGVISSVLKPTLELTPVLRNWRNLSRDIVFFPESHMAIGNTP